MRRDTLGRNMELPDDLYDRIEELSEDGNEFCEEERFSEAIQKWSYAIELLPEPKTDWEAYTWLSASIGDAHYQQDAFEPARQALYDALNGPDGPENPFIWYRLGQCEIRLGNEAGGVDKLLKAYMLDGEDIFLSEDGGKEFLEILRAKNLVD